ncbi:1171_t:CDS:2, partial [Acaulospora colombiana]
MSAQPQIPYPVSQTDKRPSQSPHSSSLSPDALKRTNNPSYSLDSTISANPTTNSAYSGTATDAMIGPSAPWDPNNPTVPSYPSEETYLARYHSQAYHDRNADESRNSTSTGPYSTAMYALSPESLHSNGSPQAMGANIPHQQQQPYYTTP